MDLNTLRICALKSAYIPLFRSVSSKLFCIGQCSILGMDKQKNTLKIWIITLLLQVDTNEAMPVLEGSRSSIPGWWVTPNPSR